MIKGKTKVSFLQENIFFGKMFVLKFLQPSGLYFVDYARIYFLSEELVNIDFHCKKYSLALFQI